MLWFEGRTDFGDVQIVGVFIKVNKKGEPKNPELAKTIDSIAYRLNVPIIKVTAKGLEYSPTSPDILENGAGYNGDNCRYWIDFKRGRFDYIDDEQNVSSITQSEAETAINLIVEHAAANANDDALSILTNLKHQIPNLPKVREIPLQARAVNLPKFHKTFPDFNC